MKNKLKIAIIFSTVLSVLSFNTIANELSLERKQDLQKYYETGFSDGSKTFAATMTTFSLLALIEDKNDDLSKEFIESMFKISSSLSDCIEINGNLTPQNIALECKKEMSIFLANTTFMLTEMKKYWDNDVDQSLKLKD